MYVYIYVYIYIALSFNRSLYIHLLYITLYNHTWSLCHKLPTIMYQVIIYIYSFKQNLVSWYPVIFLVVRTWENTVHNKKLTLLFLVQSTRRVSKSARVAWALFDLFKNPTFRARVQLDLHSPRKWWSPGWWSWTVTDDRYGRYGDNQ